MNNIIISYPPDLIFSSLESKLKYADLIISEWIKEKYRLIRLTEGDNTDLTIFK